MIYLHGKITTKMKTQQKIDKIIEKWGNENYGEDFSMEDLDILDLRTQLKEGLK